MQLLEGQTVHSISDLINDIECEHLTQLERQVALKQLQAPKADAGIKLIARKGDEHEQRYLAKLKAEHGEAVVEFPGQLARPGSIAALCEADLATFNAMQSGAPAIYQPTFFDGVFVGRADFLRRIEIPSQHWPWSYELIDTKLALNVKAHFPIQLAHYNAQVQRLQGTAPKLGFIALGNSLEQAFHMRDFAAYYRNRRNRFLGRIERHDGTYPGECVHCAICRWNTACDAQRDRDDHLSLVANIRQDHVAKLELNGITTLAGLAVAADIDKPAKMSQDTFAKLQAQARLQHQGRTAAPGTPAYAYELLPPRDGEGFAQLPQPDAGDIFFDIEGDPLYRPEYGLEYLWGFTLAAENEFRPFWALSDSEERTTFEAVVDFIMERRRRYPAMHVYHYAPYEISALRRLAGRYATREEAVDHLLRSQVFVDLYGVVRQSLRISQPSYSIKKLEPFYGMVRNTDVRRGDDSIVQFEEWLATGDDSILEDIKCYNDDDCRSTWLLRDWLLERKSELEATQNSQIPWRPEPMATETEAAIIDNESARALLADLPNVHALNELLALPEDVRARWMLGHLLGYHRREAKPIWWKYFDRCANLDELAESDNEAIGDLQFDADFKPYKNRPKDRNLVYRYSFPTQQHKLEAGDTPICPELAGTSFEIVSIEADNNRLYLKMPSDANHPALRSLVPGGPVGTKAQEEALKRIAEAFVRGDLGQKSAEIDMLLARAPRLVDRPAGSVIQPDVVGADEITKIIEALDSSYLVIQGPPGTGKSTKAAAIILDLMAKGKRVAILAGKHKAIHNLLHKIEEVAQQRGQHFHGLHKSSKSNADSKFESKLEEPLVRSFEKTEELNKPHMLASGVQWFLATEAVLENYDFLFIDEAGQLSLADALACAPAAKNVVLLGDPLQLAHVSQGTHPVGSGLSVLEHLLGEHATIPADRGIFLDVSYRMAPEICSFISDAVYESRLSFGDATHSNALLHAAGAESGIRYIPVEHSTNMRSSIEEAQIITTEIVRLLQANVVVRNEPARPMKPSDVLVVTPYNAQRKVIREQLAAAGITGIDVGTVDKFQGLEAPVVFYSMATSSGDDIPRNVEFLFEQNRFNVAISRAQCLAILVCSPKLLDVRCSSPGQIALVNLLCEVVEHCATC